MVINHRVSLAAVYPLVEPHQPSEFEPSTTQAAATHFEDRIAANMMNALMASNPCEDLTPVAHNKSDKSNSHQQEDDTNTCTDQSQPAENVRVNLDESKFSINLPAPAKEDKFLRNFRPGNNSPFTEEEGMLASWSPSKKISPKAVTVEDAWLYGLMKIEPVPVGLVNGNGPCNKERIEARTKAKEEGMWVREAAMAYAEKRALKKTA